MVAGEKGSLKVFSHPSGECVYEQPPGPVPKPVTSLFLSRLVSGLLFYPLMAHSDEVVCTYFDQTIAFYTENMNVHRHVCICSIAKAHSLFSLLAKTMR